MKLLSIRCLLGAFAIGTFLTLSPRVLADESKDLLQQADDLVKQAWNPGGDAPATEDRVQMLTKAADLANKVPDHRLHGTRMEAIRLIKLAIDSLKAGDDSGKINEDLQDADRQLRSAIEITEAH